MEDPEEESPSLPFELKDVMFALIRSWVLIGIFATLGLSAGIVLAASQANYYTSRAQLLLKIGARERLTPEDQLDAGKGGGRDTSSGIGDEIKMLQGPALYTKLAERLGPTNILAPADPTRYVSEKMSLPKRLFHELQASLIGVGEHDSPEVGIDQTEHQVSESAINKAGELLMINTALRAERFSDIITVLHTASSAERAQVQCQALVEAFIERHKEQFSAGALLEDTKKQVDRAEQELETARTDYFSHIAECGNISIDEELDDFQKDLIATRQELADAIMRDKEITAEIAELSKQLAVLPETVEVETLPVTGPNEEYVTKSEQLTTWEMEKEDLQFEPGMTNEIRQKRLERYEARIDELRKELQGIDRTIVIESAGTEQVANEAWLESKAKIDELRVEAASLAVAIETLPDEIASMEATKEKMLSCKKSHGVMKALTDNLQVAYDRYEARYAELEGLDSIDKEGKTNLQVLEPPDLPADKAGPARAKIVVIGLLGGAMAGVGIALLRQLMDSRLRHPHVVERVLDVPLIAVVPERKAVRMLKKATLAKSGATG